MWEKVKEGHGTIFQMRDTANKLMLMHTCGCTHTQTHTLPPFQSVKYLAVQAVLVNTVLMAVINETCSLAGTLISKSLSQSWQRSEHKGRREPPNTFTEKKPPGRRENNYSNLHALVRSSWAVKKKSLKSIRRGGFVGRRFKRIKTLIKAHWSNINYTTMVKCELYFHIKATIMKPF